jgi:hypothetical protein
VVKAQIASALIFGAFSFGTPQAGPFDLPDPKVFARSEDQERARLLSKPCTEADVGRGCYRFDGRVSREMPCRYHIDARTIRSLPTDQCYKMEAPRRYRGVWVDEFEGQRFIPEGTSPPEWPRTDPKSAGWSEQFERARLATIWFDASRVTVDQKFRQRGVRRFIEFIGRKTMYPGAYGHLGMSGQEVIVDRVISLRGCPETGVCR